MKIHIVDFIEEQKRYIEAYSEEKAEQLWNELVLGKKWEDLCAYSPVPLDDRKPKAIRDIKMLKAQTERMAKIDFPHLQAFFDKAAALLPNYDEDPITAALIASDPANETVNRLQNGVAGTSLFGNILIQINPFIAGFERWIEYVFAHEYHHTVWGNYWFNLHGSELRHDLLQALVIDGQADSFALSLCPELEPQWLYLHQEGFVQKIFEEQYKEHLLDTDFDYAAFMFGNHSSIPWCGGYAVGYFLIQKYIRKTGIDLRPLLENGMTERKLVE